MSLGVPLPQTGFAFVWTSFGGRELCCGFAAYIRIGPCSRIWLSLWEVDTQSVLMSRVSRSRSQLCLMFDFLDPSGMGRCRCTCHQRHACAKAGDPKGPSTQLYKVSTPSHVYDS